MHIKALARILKRLDWAAANLQKAIIIAVSVMVTCSMFIEVVARYFFSTCIFGLEELTGLTAVWLYLIGASYGSYDRSQIKAEFIHLFIKNERRLCMLRVLAVAVAVVVSCYLINWSIGYIYWSVTKHEITPTLQIPTVIFQIPILIGAILMAVYFFVEMLELARQAYRHRPASE